MMKIDSFSYSLPLAPGQPRNGPAPAPCRMPSRILGIEREGASPVEPFDRRQRQGVSRIDVLQSRLNANTIST